MLEITLMEQSTRLCLSFEFACIHIKVSPIFLEQLIVYIKEVPSNGTFRDEKHLLIVRH